MESQNIELLRFTTAGSVDDGKSTLIGRLLYDSKSIFQDQLDAVEESSKNKGFDYVDLSLPERQLYDKVYISVLSKLNFYNPEQRFQVLAALTKPAWAHMHRFEIPARIV